MPFRSSSRPAVAVIGAVAVAVLVSACGGTAVGDLSSATQTTRPATPEATRTVNVDAALEAATSRQSARLLATTRSFNTCDARESAVERAERCRKQVRAVAEIAEEYADEIRQLGGEQAYDRIVTAVDGVVVAGRKVARRCSAQRSQRCDQALAGYRAAEQSMLWELELSS
jgi:hypothetical protein